MYPKNIQLTNQYTIFNYTYWGYVNVDSLDAMIIILTLCKNFKWFAEGEIKLLSVNQIWDIRMDRHGRNFMSPIPSDEAYKNNDDLELVEQKWYLHM
jgi:hypothetical protein